MLKNVLMYGVTIMWSGIIPFRIIEEGAFLLFGTLVFSH